MDRHFDKLVTDDNSVYYCVQLLCRSRQNLKIIDAFDDIFWKLKKTRIRNRLPIILERDKKVIRKGVVRFWKLTYKECPELEVFTSSEVLGSRQGFRLLGPRQGFRLLNITFEVHWIFISVWCNQFRFQFKVTDENEKSKKILFQQLIPSIDVLLKCSFY